MHDLCNPSFFFQQIMFVYSSYVRVDCDTRVAICVSRVLLDGLQKKERLLVV